MVQDAHPDFKIGHGKTSQTAFVQCYDPKDEGSNTSELIYIDSPGFEDSNGKEVDIATSAMFSEVAKRCKSLRFIILISFVSLLEDRGGAMQTILKLVRSFTGDFKRDKKSFMFIFTHANQIQGVPDNVEGAMASLKNEIFRMVEGKSDPESVDVLKFIQKSLRKGFPFVQILLPLQTNFQLLVADITSKTTPMTPKFLAGHCGLTQASRLTLSGELQHKLHQLGQELSNEDLDVDRVTELIKLFQYFCRYIQIEDVRRADQDVERLMSHYTKDQRQSLDIEVQRSTVSDQDVGEANIAVIKKKLQVLQGLDKVIPRLIRCNNIKAGIHQQVLKLQESLLLKQGESFSGICYRLDKLKAWATYFAEFSSLYKDTIKHLEQHLKHCFDVVKVFEKSKLEALDAGKLECLICAISVLKSVSEDCERLETHLCVQSAASTYLLSIKALQSTIHSWGECSSLSTLKAAIKDDQQLLHWIAIAHCVELLAGLLDSGQFNIMLQEDTMKSRNKLRSDLEEAIAECYSELKKICVSSPKDFQKGFKRLEKTTNQFSQLGATWKQLASLHSAFVGETKSKLLSWSKEIEVSIKLACTTGVRDGVTDSKTLAMFASYSWFDECLKPGERFLSNCKIHYLRQYKDRASVVKTHAYEGLSQLIDVSKDSDTGLSTLKEWLPELEQILKLASVMDADDFSNADIDIRSKLLQHVQNLSQDAEMVIANWRAAIRENPMDMASQAHSLCDAGNGLDLILREGGEIAQLDAKCRNLLESACIIQRAKEACCAFSMAACTLLESKARYDEKARCLNLIDTLGKYRTVALFLPSSDEARKKARESVIEDAKEIEDLISKKAERDLIEERLTGFRDATVLDKFISEESSSRLALLQLSENQEDSHIDDLNTLIEDEDFCGIHNFLREVDSSDQVKPHKFRRALHKIAAFIGEALSATRCDLDSPVSKESCQRVVKRVQMLEKARDELNSYVEEMPGGLSLARELGTITDKINENLAELIKSFNSHQREINFEGMGIQQQALSIQTANFKQLLTQSSRKDAAAARAQYRKAMEDVSSTVDKFFMGKQDYNKLLRILSSLRRCCENRTSELPELAELYETTKTLLTNRINDAFHALSPNQYYDDAIEALCVLQRHMRSGLREHLVLSELSFDCDSQLEEWREQKRKIDLEMEFDGGDMEEKVKRWEACLASLYKKSNAWFFFLNNSENEEAYEKKRKELLGKAKDWFNRGMKALEYSDYIAAQESIHLLELMDQYLSNHITITTCEELKKQAQKVFLTACKDLQTNVVLEARRSRFDGSFSDYRHLLLQVPCIISCIEARKAFIQTNKCIHDALSADISEIRQNLESFDFAKAKAKIQSTRKFGGYIADHCTLFHEQVKNSKHLELDQWLESILNLSQQHFGYGRSLSYLKQFAILEIPPRNSKSAIQKAYKKLAKR